MDRAPPQAAEWSSESASAPSPPLGVLYGGTSPPLMTEPRPAYYHTNYYYPPAPTLPQQSAAGAVPTDLSSSEVPSRGGGAMQPQHQRQQLSLGEACLTLCISAGQFGLNALSSVCRLITGAVDAWTKPAWEYTPDYQPYSSQSYQIGDYEYEVMVYRRPRGCLAKICRP